jgi:hypothetical protein
MRQTWPTREQWDKASVQVESQWRKRTLTEAAHELAQKNEPILGKDLARLLFVNWRREIEWKLKEKLKLTPGSYSPPGLYAYGQRGISLRLFRQRYKRSDIAEARETAEGIVRSEGTAKDRKDAAGYGSAVTIRSDHSEDNNKDVDALHVEDKTKMRIDASVMRAIRDCKKALREAKTDAEKKGLQDHLRQLKLQENFSLIYY